jgi:PAS domain-containing protein
LAGAIDRLIELDQRDSARHERVTFLALTDAVIDALPDGLVVTNRGGNIVLFNEKAEFMNLALIRYSRHEGGERADAGS